MILLVGSEGSMGKRYQAILNHMEVDHVCRDEGDWVDDDLWAKVDGTIIASPTETHTSWIRKVGEMGPVLCEKPICKSVSELSETFHWCRENNVKLSMMLQYSMFDHPTFEGDTYYNYYNTGKDGLNWDCIQIIGLARSSCSVYANSPVWECQINGNRVERGRMDWAYYEFTKRWINGEIKQDYNWLLDIHHKASEWTKY